MIAAQISAYRAVRASPSLRNPELRVAKTKQATIEIIATIKPG